MTDEELIKRLRLSGYNSPTIAADRIEALVKERDSIRDAALREAAVACDIWPADEWHMHTKSGYIFAAEECQRNILALVGEKK